MLTSVDVTVARWCAAHRSHALDHLVVLLASQDVLVGFIAVASLVGIALSMWFGGWIPFARVALVLVAVSTLTGWIKPVFDRARPPADLALYHVGGAAMPSSHALMTAAVVVAVVMADWWVSPRLRRAVLVVGMAGCVMIGAAMIYLGVHWLTDVLVGWAIGIGLTGVLMRLTAVTFSERTPT